MAAPVIDAHHHIWRWADLPWLNGPNLPRIFGEYSAICRDYPVDEFLADVTPHGVTKSVYVQANWAEAEFMAEAEYIHRTAAETGWPHAFVGYADLMAQDARFALDRVAALPLTKGVRMLLHWHETPLFRHAARPDLMNDPTFRRNLAHVADLGWSFDLQVFQGQMADAARLVHDFPTITFILVHGGLPHDESEAGWQNWREGLSLIAAEPNAAIKLSGLGTFVHRVDPVFIGRVFKEAVGLFGPDRCLYGSNFPIEKLWTSYGPLIEAYRAAVAEWAPGAERAIFHDTAARVYRIAG